MAGKVTLKISAAAAPYVGKETPKGEKLKAAGGEVPLSANDLGTLLFFLAHDADPDVSAMAVRTLRELPEAFLVAMAGFPDLHPRVLDLLARLHAARPAVVARIVSHPQVDEETRLFLAGKGVSGIAAPPEPAPGEGEPRETPTGRDAITGGDEGEEQGEDTGEDLEAVDEESEEFKSKYKLAQQMGIGDKIKMALTGDKEWRSILIKDSNKLVSGGVIKNPRLTEPEVLAIAKSAVQNEEIMRVICNNKEWLKNYQIRKALVQNHKTPLPFAIKHLGSLSEKDIAAIAKSKNVSSVISTQARRILLNKQQKGR